MLRILEPEVIIRAREKDEQLVQSAAENAAKQYTEISGREVKTTIETSLSDESCVTLSINSFLSLKY